MVSTFDHTLLNPCNGQVRRVKPIIEQCHLESIPVRFLDVSPIRSGRKSRFDTETLLSGKMRMNLFYGNPTSIYLHALYVLRA